MQSALHGEIVPAALEVLQRSTQPLSIDQLRRQLNGPFRVAPKQKPELLARLQADDRIHCWPGTSKSPRFWHRDPREVAATAAVEIASQSSLDAAALVRALTKAAHRYPRTEAAALVAQLITERRLYEDPPWGRKRKISTTAPDPERYRPQLEKELTPILEKYAALGITPQAVVDRMCSQTSRRPHVSVAALIGEALSRIEPRKGLVVAVSKIRHAPELEGVSKPDFDAAAMQLFSERRVFLHHHTAPHTLTAAERDDLIADERGNFYVGIAWRESELDAGLRS